MTDDVEEKHPEGCMRRSWKRDGRWGLEAQKRIGGAKSFLENGG